MKQRQNRRGDALGEKMSIKARHAAKDEVDLETSVGKGDNNRRKSGTNTTCSCRFTVAKLIQDECENYHVSLAGYDKFIRNK